MAWFRNTYHCTHCESEWEDEWSCGCDDECPICGSDWSPADSEDVSAFIEAEADGYSVYYSPPEAEHRPDYTYFASTPFRNVALILEKIAADAAKPL